jgi:hypothetical protein
MDTAAMGLKSSAALGRCARGTIAQLRVVADVSLSSLASAP